MPICIWGGVQGPTLTHATGTELYGMGGHKAAGILDPDESTS